LWCYEAWLQSQHRNLLLLSCTLKTDAVYSPETLVPTNVVTGCYDSESCAIIRDILKALLFYLEFLFKWPPVFLSRRPVSRFTAQSKQPTFLTIQYSQGSLVLRCGYFYFRKSVSHMTLLSRLTFLYKTSWNTRSPPGICSLSLSMLKYKCVVDKHLKKYDNQIIKLK
jgi:hypothetical protein